MDLKATEDTFIGSLLLAEEKIVDVVEKVKPDYFTTDKARESYSEMVKQFKAGGYVDINSVTIARPELAMYLAVTTSSGASFLVEEYGGRICKFAQERRVDAALNHLVECKAEPSEKLDMVLELYNDEVVNGVKSYSIGDILKRFESSISKNKDRGSMGISTGVRGLQELYIEYVEGQIWLMGAYTSVGKTAMMTQKICNIIREQPETRIVIVSTEMTESQVTARILANLSQVHSQRILTGNFRNGEEEIVLEYKDMLSRLHITICDDVYNIGDIERLFHKEKLTGGVSVGFIDYVQNCRVPDAKSSYQAGEDLAKRLQKLAKDTECCLVCLSQVSNSVGRGDTDQLEYKGAGEWSAVADLGIFLQRNKENNKALKYNIKKNRHGALGEIVFEYSDDFSRLIEVN